MLLTMEELRSLIEALEAGMQSGQGTKICSHCEEVFPDDEYYCYCQESD